MKYGLMLSGLMVLILAGCGKKQSQAEIDEEIIEEYISNNDLDAKSTESGLFFVIENPGTGTQPTLQSEVKVSYKGYLTNGTVFDESTSEVWFSLRNLIPGWQEGIPMLRNGGTGKFIVPSHLGYGSRAVGNIPANSVLVFDIELHGVR